MFEFFSYKIMIKKVKINNVKKGKYIYIYMEKVKVIKVG